LLNEASSRIRTAGMALARGVITAEKRVRSMRGSIVGRLRSRW
jgi:hypothetical protein